ncbi:MAG: hypothetical protein LBT39_00525 [Treponema sp.]|nr:hypothetical protein [Treponema sp.]
MGISWMPIIETMTNNTYLLRNTGTETECLFDSYTTIPYFWFALIDTKVIKKMGEEIIRLFRRSQRRIMSNSHITIKLPKEYMIRNAEQGENFFKEFQPDLSGLFHEFAVYLDSLFAEGDVLELNIIEITDFNNTVRSMNQVKDVVRSIQLREDANRYFEIYGTEHDPLTLAGDDRSYRNEFRGYSAEYAAFCDVVEKELNQRPGLLGKIKNRLGSRSAP